MADLCVGGIYEARREELINAVMMGSSSSMHSFVAYGFVLDNLISFPISSSVVGSEEDKGWSSVALFIA